MHEMVLEELGLRASDDDLALFLDFDGTLVDIVERPDRVAVDPALPGILDRLQMRLGGALAIVSGRPITFLDACFAPKRFDVAGLHGLEHRLQGHLSACRPEEHPRLRAAVEDLRSELTSDAGILIEDKGCSVAIHWRLAPERAAFARARVEAAADRLGPSYRIQYGKAVAEILPAAASKGRIIETFLNAAPYLGRRPIFIGDDVTDENGFETVNERGGISVRVGEGTTVAQARLGTPAALRHCLSAWAKGASIHFERNRKA